MIASSRSDDFLNKTLEHLKKTVLPRVKLDKKEFSPPSENWDRIINAIEEAITSIEAELATRSG